MTEPRVGRPEIGPQVKVRLPAEVIEQVDALAAEQRTTRSAWLRQAITTATITTVVDRILDQLRAMTPDDAERLLQVAAADDRATYDAAADDAGQSQARESAQHAARQALHDLWRDPQWQATAGPYAGRHPLDQARADAETEISRIVGEHEGETDLLDAGISGPPWETVAAATGDAVLATLARDLITREEYAALTRVWAAAVGLWPSAGPTAGD